MDQTQIGTVVLISTSLIMFYYIWKLRNRNISSSEEKPKIAGEDELSGAALNPSQFDEPDDDALDQMQDLLEKSAETQGFTYEE
ncbi:MAG: hypothetical protein QF440_00855 [Candidatus Thalassarchaeaceae archaeon]|nr:hypothetical protein [Candidatus Thalassarchaeaceae archaeon]